MTTARTVPLDARLWGALGRLSAALGRTPESLVQQAVERLLADHGALPEARAEAARRVLDTANGLERALTPPAAAAPLGLWVGAGSGPPVRVERERFVIGRGRHCDLVLDGAKVSREHAVIRREADGWWLEDLGSSNGTWHEAARVERRRIRHGDVFLVSAEKIECVIAPAT